MHDRSLEAITIFAVCPRQFSNYLQTPRHFYVSEGERMDATRPEMFRRHETIILATRPHHHWRRLRDSGRLDLETFGSRSNSMTFDHETL